MRYDLIEIKLIDQLLELEEFKEILVKENNRLKVKSFLLQNQMRINDDILKLLFELLDEF